MRFDLNYEHDMLLRNDAITRQVYDRQQQYITQSDAVTLENAHVWSYRRRIWNNIVAIIGPTL